MDWFPHKRWSWYHHFISKNLKLSAFTIPSSESVSSSKLKALNDLRGFPCLEALKILLNILWISPFWRGIWSSEARAPQPRIRHTVSRVERKLYLATKNLTLQGGRLGRWGRGGWGVMKDDTNSNSLHLFFLGKLPPKITINLCIFWFSPKWVPFHDLCVCPWRWDICLLKWCGWLFEEPCLVRCVETNLPLYRTEWRCKAGVVGGWTNPVNLHHFPWLGWKYKCLKRPISGAVLNPGSTHDFSDLINLDFPKYNRKIPGFIIQAITGNTVSMWRCYDSPWWVSEVFTMNQTVLHPCVIAFLSQFLVAPISIGAKWTRYWKLNQTLFFPYSNETRIRLWFLKHTNSTTVFFLSAAFPGA